MELGISAHIHTYVVWFHDVSVLMHTKDEYTIHELCEKMNTNMDAKSERVLPDWIHNGQIM